VPAFFLRASAARYLVLHFHRNGEDLGLIYPFADGMRRLLEVHVLVVEFPGYGICPGSCSEDSLLGIANAALRFAVEVLQWPVGDIIVMGSSLGAAVAVRLASTCNCHGLILVAPFLSLVDAARRFVGFFAPLVAGNLFDSRVHIAKVQVPTLVIHGKQDNVVPCEQGKRLYDLCPSPRKLFVSPEEMNHNVDLLSHTDFFLKPVLRFFALPDYAFYDPTVPEAAFDKRLCPQYWNEDAGSSQTPSGGRATELVEEPPTNKGPQKTFDGAQRASGDVDNVDGSDVDGDVEVDPEHIIEADAISNVPAVPANIARQAPRPPKPFSEHAVQGGSSDVVQRGKHAVPEAPPLPPTCERVNVIARS
jgi:pimeloyl-ACP methyl ester carboxylesterase